MCSVQHQHTLIMVSHHHYTSEFATTIICHINLMTQHHLGQIPSWLWSVHSDVPIMITTRFSTESRPCCRSEDTHPFLTLTIQHILGSCSLFHVWRWSYVCYHALWDTLSCTKHVWYSEHGMYCRFKFILEQAMSATHIAVISCTRTHSDEEEFLKKWLSWRE